MSKFSSSCLVSAVFFISAGTVSAASMPQQQPLAPTQSPVATKSFNVQSSILADLVGAVNLNVNFRVAPALSIGPTAEYWSISASDSGSGQSDSSSLWSLGAQAEYAFNGHVMQDGFLLNPYIAYNSAQNVDVEKYGVSGISGGMMMQYQWMWQSGFNMQLGVGAGYSSVKSSNPGSTGDSKVQSTHGMASFELGYAF